jgi:flagellin-like protein
MNDRAVSPVIGVVIVVAVTVILASTVGAFVFGYTDIVSDTAPQADFTFDWDQNPRTLTIEHAAGDEYTARNTDRLHVVITDEDETGQNDYLRASDDWANASNGAFPVSSGDTFVITGEQGGGDLDVEVAGTNSEDFDDEIHEPEVGDVVKVYWYGDDQSFVVAKYTIPAGEDP